MYICTYVNISAKIQIWKYKSQTVNNGYLGQQWSWSERRKGGQGAKGDFSIFTLYNHVLSEFS